MEETLCTGYYFCSFVSESRQSSISVKLDQERKTERTSKSPEICYFFKERTTVLSGKGEQLYYLFKASSITLSPFNLTRENQSRRAAGKKLQFS